MIFKSIRHSVLAIILVFVVAACAKIGYPSGGPIDITPPIVVEYKPEYRATNFNAKKIEITFDEFIQLSDATNNFTISPPLKKRPEVYVRGKSVIVKFQEELKPNTTYRLYFANSIVDLNHSNPLRNFEYVFSTGSYIDSLALRGRLLNSFTHQPEKDQFYVMLYSKLQDSIPRKQLPDYIARTDKNGYFSLGHIRPDTFRLFALRDMNQNVKFDLPNEGLAFADSLIHLDNRFYMHDSILCDTTVVDTVTKATFKPQIMLYSFVEEHAKQYLKKYDRPSPEIINMVFNSKVDDSLAIEPLNFRSKNWIKADHRIKGDTASFWITDTMLLQLDTMKVRITYRVLDSLERLKPKSDTILLTLKKKLKSKKETSRPNQTSRFELSSNISDNSSSFDLNSRIWITSTLPFESLDKSKIRFLKYNDDQNIVPVKYSIETDTGFSRRFFIDTKFEAKAKYILSIDTLCLRSIYGQNNDSVGIEFETQRDDYYGTISLQLSGSKGDVIVELMSGEDIVKQKIINKDQKLTFDFIKPGKYTVRAIFDSNRNKRWDTGLFSKELEPEKVVYFVKEFNIRSNFEIEESWDLQTGK